MRPLVFAALCAVAGCAKPPTGTAPAPSADDPLAEMARAGIRDPDFGDLLADHWRWRLETSPTEATYLGIPGFDDRWPDSAPAAVAARREARDGFLARAVALAAPADPRDAAYLSQFIARLEADRATDACRFETWSLSPRSHAMSDLFGILDLQAMDTAAEVQVAVDRIRAWAADLPVHEAQLARGMADGWVANATSLGKIIEQLDRQLATPPADWPVFEDVPDAEAPRLEAALVEHVVPALTAHRAFLADTLLPQARGDEAPGLAGLPDAQACYAARILSQTTLPLGAVQVHATGLAELQRIHAEFRELGARALGTDDLAEIFRRLREDPALRFDTAASIVETAEEALARAEAAVPAAFGSLPDTPCVVREIPAYEAPYTTIAYYRQPSADGTKPGEYFVNTHAPTTRPRHEAEVLAFHESVPGHHLQIALSYELPAVPAFHRYGGATAFVEGWALYTERLADELGLYSDDLQRLGMLSFDAWRASRLVVDSGLHQLGWSREDAEAFLEANTPLATNNIVNEVDRYVTWPGQALAYKTGQLQIMALRAEAEAALGDRFDLSAFHDVVLGEGAVSLPRLDERVRAWVAAHDTP